MRVCLLHPDRDFDPDRPLPANHAALRADLELDILLNAMAGGDRSLLKVAGTVVLTSLADDCDTILFRQAVLRDCLANAAAIRDIYALAGEALEHERMSGFALFATSPDALLSGAIRVIRPLCDVLRKLRTACLSAQPSFTSAGLKRFCDGLQGELTDRYFAEIAAALRRLRFRRGVLISAELGEGGQGWAYELDEVPLRDRHWILGLVMPAPESASLYVDRRDDGGWQALGELRNRGLNLVADAVRQSADQMVAFFRTLHREIGFYVACLNLHEVLARKQSVTFPTPLSDRQAGFTCRALCDVGLALAMAGKVVGNDVAAGGKQLIIVTGANRGGKSTFLRSVGLAQIMMQAGMFVAAESFGGVLCDGVFTHFAREEDTSMRSGKFDEELRRMSDIADGIGRHAMVLFNESFAGTNEREGSDVAHQIVSALLDAGVRVIFVSHMYAFSQRFLETAADRTLFLRAERAEDGSRTFRLTEGAPLRSGFAKDLYEGILSGVLDASQMKSTLR